MGFFKFHAAGFVATNPLKSVLRRISAFISPDLRIQRLGGFDELPKTLDSGELDAVIMQNQQAFI